MTSRLLPIVSMAALVTFGFLQTVRAEEGARAIADQSVATGPARHDATASTVASDATSQPSITLDRKAGVVSPAVRAAPAAQTGGRRARFGTGKNSSAIGADCARISRARESPSTCGWRSSIRA